MKLKIIAGGNERCAKNACPTVYALDDEHVVIQGYRLTEIPDNVPPNEDAIRIPKSLLLDAVKQLSESIQVF